MKIFVTNLKGTEHRRAWMQRQLGALGLDFEFIDCYDGRDWTPEDIRPLVSQELFELHLKNERWLTKGAIAATKTHLELIFDRVTGERMDYALCLEDDTILSADFKKRLEEVEKALRTHRVEGVILLHHNLHSPVSLRELAAIPAGPGLTIYKVPEGTQIGSGAAYIVSRGAAARIRENQRPIRLIGDWWHDHPGVDIYFVYPLLVHTGMFSSTLGYKSKGLFEVVRQWLPVRLKRYIRTRQSARKSMKNIKA